MSLYIPSASMSMVPSHICQSPMLFALLHPHTMPDVCFYFCNWWRSGWSFWSVELRTRHPFFAETSWNVDSSEYSTNFHHLFDYLRWALAQRTWQHRCMELMYSFLLEKQIFKLHFLMQQQTVVNDSGFLKYSWAHVAIFNTAAWRFLMQCHLRAQRSSTFNWGFLPCPTCTMISLDSLNLFTILCMVLLTLLSWNLAQSDEPTPRFPCKDWDAPFIPKHDTLTYYQFTCLLWTVSKQFNVDIL